MTRATAFSLPGISDEASTTTSPGSMLIAGWFRFAIRDNAAIGSPCEGCRGIAGSDQVDQGAAGDPQVPQVTSDSHVAHHRPADKGDLAPVCDRYVEHLLHPVNVARERRDHDPAGRLGEDPVEHRRDLPLMRRIPRNLSVRGVHHEQVDTGVTEPREGIQVGPASVQRELVHLEVAGVQDQPRRRPDGECQSVGDRVVDGEELNLERAEPFSSSLGDFQLVGIDLVLDEFLLDEGKGES